MAQSQLTWVWTKLLWGIFMWFHHAFLTTLPPAACCPDAPALCDKSSISNFSPKRNWMGLWDVPLDPWSPRTRPGLLLCCCHCLWSGQAPILCQHLLSLATLVAPRGTPAAAAAQPKTSSTLAPWRQTLGLTIDTARQLTLGGPDSHVGWGLSSHWSDRPKLSYQPIPSSCVPQPFLIPTLPLAQLARERYLRMSFWNCHFCVSVCHEWVSA